MKYRRSGFLSAFVVSWCASAYHLSAALEGFSGTSRMSLRTLRALLSHTVFSSDRFLITLFACTALLARTRQQTKASVWRGQCAQSPTCSYAVQNVMNLRFFFFFFFEKRKLNGTNKLIFGQLMIKSRRLLIRNDRRFQSIKSESVEGWSDEVLCKTKFVHKCNWSFNCIYNRAQKQGAAWFCPVLFEICFEFLRARNSFCLAQCWAAG